MAIILQIGSFDQERYPDVLRGIMERIRRPAIEYVFVDTIEQARELKRRITQEIPTDDQPSVFAIPAGPISASDAFTALVTGIPPTNRQHI
jgi:hypothetical protein